MAEVNDSSQLYNLVLGATLAMLCAQRKIAQKDMAERATITTSKMSRILKGQTGVDVSTMNRLCALLSIEPARFLALINQGMERTREAARQTLKIAGREWWQPVQAQVGEVGLQALVSFGVASVMADQGKRAA